MSRTVLAIEFRGVGYSADFGFLKRLGLTSKLHRIDPLGDHITKPLALADQTRRMVGRLPCSPDLVLTYCATAALGAHIAEIVGADLLMIDPYPVTRDDMYRDFANLCGTLNDGGALEPERFRSMEISQWEDVLQTSRDDLARRHGGDEVAYGMTDDLLDRYRAWLRFLNACMNARPAAPGGRVTVIAGKYRSRLDSLLTEPEKMRLILAEVEADTLDSAEVQTLVASYVASPRAG
jgi:hypothetical protein